MSLKDLALDENGDILIAKDGDMQVTSSIQQAIAIKLRWALGEWVYDPAKGIPYFTKIFVKSPNVQEITNIIRNEILDVEGVTSIESCVIDVDSSTRRMTAKIKATANGETVESEVSIG